jgi:hypothetical protein
MGGFQHSQVCCWLVLTVVLASMRPHCSGRRLARYDPVLLLSLLTLLLLLCLHALLAVFWRRWQVQDSHKQGQAMLLASLHSHCLQLLAEAQCQLPAAACVLGQHNHSSGSSVDGGSDKQQLQQQRQAWQQCLAQVQRNLMLVLQLTKHWQHHNTIGSFPEFLRKKQ